MADELERASRETSVGNRAYGTALITVAAFLTAEEISIGQAAAHRPATDDQELITAIRERAQAAARDLLTQAAALPPTGRWLIALPGRGHKPAPKPSAPDQPAPKPRLEPVPVPEPEVAESAPPPSNTRVFPPAAAVAAPRPGPRHRRPPHSYGHTHPAVTGLALLPPLVLLLLAAYLVLGGLPPDKDLVVLVSASSAEPVPTLSDRVSSLLRDTATRDVAILDTDGQTHGSHGDAGRSGAALAALSGEQAAAGWGTTVQATPRRAEFDLLRGIRTAVRDREPGTLVVISSGLSTEGRLDLRQVGWSQDPDRLAESLRGEDVLPNLTNWRVVFSGLGDTAGQQPPLPGATRQTLSDYWRSICLVANAADCEIDDEAGTATQPNQATAAAVVPVPGVQLLVEPDGQNTLVFSDALLFRPDSVVFAADGRRLLSETASRIAGSTAPPSNPSDVRVTASLAADRAGVERVDLASRRARVLAEALTTSGVARPIRVGVDPAGADGMRITY